MLKLKRNWDDYRSERNSERIPEPNRDEPHRSHWTRSKSPDTGRR